MTKETDLAWAAGFIDGEGYLGISSHKNTKGTTSYSGVVSVCQNKIEPLLFLQRILGGAVAKHKQCNNVRNCQPYIYTWTTYSWKAQVALEALLPYLVLKKQQAQIVSGWQSNKMNCRGGRRQIPSAELHERILVFNLLRELNRSDK